MLTWTTLENGDRIGTRGGLRYLVRAPDRTAGWRVWCQMSQGIATTGGLIITMKAADKEAAIEAAETHFREFVAGLVGEPVGWSYEIATRAVGGVTGDRRYDGWEERLTKHKPNTPPGSVQNLRPVYTLTPTQPNTPGA